MSDSCGAPDSEVRRKLMRGAVVAGSAPTLAGCDWIKKVLGLGPTPSPPLVGPPGVDAHCHIFNIRDMPAYAFVVDVVVENPVLKPLAAPVARLFVEICRAPAKTYEDEKSVLTAILANPLQPMPAVATAAEIDFMVAGGLAQYIANFTSIGKNAPPAGWAPDFNLLITELFKTYLPGVIDPAKTPAQNAAAILAALANPATLQTLVANMSAPVTPAVSFGAYAAPSSSANGLPSSRNTASRSPRTSPPSTVARPRSSSRRRRSTSRTGCPTRSSTSRRRRSRSRPSS